MRLSPQALATIEACASMVHHELREDPATYEGWNEVLDSLATMVMGLATEVRTLWAEDGVAVFTETQLRDIRQWAVQTKAKVGTATEGPAGLTRRLAAVLDVLAADDLALRRGLMEGRVH